MKLFQIDKLFDIVKGTRLTKQNMVPGTVKFIGSTEFNNGVTARIVPPNTKKLHPANTITVCYNGSVGTAFYQDSPFWASDDINVLYPKFKMNAQIASYIIAAISKVAKKYGYSYKWTKNFMEKDEILLPTISLLEPDWSYMEAYIRELEADRIRELETYLQVTGLSSYTLTDEEKELIRGGAGNPAGYCNVTIGDLFTKLNLKPKIKVSKREDVSTVCTREFDLPLVNAKHGNNGIMFYGRSSDWEYAENTIDIVNDGAISTGDVYAQPQKTGVLYNAYLVKPKYFGINENILLYLSTCLQKSIKLKFGYDNKAVWQRVAEEKIYLPHDANGDVDYNYMSKFVGIVKKQVIKNFVLWKDKEIEYMKKVVGRAPIRR